jgi:hypothetical protein
VTVLPALVRGELLRQLRALPILVTTAGVVVFRIVSTWREMPVWPRDLADTAVSALAVGAGCMLAASASLLRERDRDVTDFLESLPVGRRTRVTALLIASLVAAALVAGTAVGLQVATLALGSVPVGRLDLLDPLTGVAAAVLLTATGVALAAWLPSPVTVPLAVAVVFWTLLQFPGNWLLPVVPDQHLLVDPPRPPISHLVYVAGLALAAAGTALLRARQRLAPTLTVAAAAVLVVITAAATLTSPQARAYAAEGDPHRPGDRPATAEATACRTSGGIRYCALPVFSAWIPLWRDAVEPIAAVVPTGVRDRLPDVVQELPVGAVDPRLANNTAFVPVHWGRHGGEVAFRRALAGQVAALAVGLPGPKSSEGTAGCRTDGQARVVVALWLIAQTEPPVLPRSTDEYVEDDRGGRLLSIGVSDLGFVTYGETELDFARRLASLPGAAPRIRRHWAELTDPHTTLARAADLLGVPAPSAGADRSDTPSAPEVCS